MGPFGQDLCYRDDFRYVDKAFGGVFFFAGVGGVGGVVIFHFGFYVGSLADNSKSRGGSCQR